LPNRRRVHHYLHRKLQEPLDDATTFSRRVASIHATLGASEEKGKASQIIAKKIGISTATYERGRKIIEKGTDELKSSLRRGTIGMTNVYNQIRRQEAYAGPTSCRRCKIPVQG